MSKDTTREVRWKGGPINDGDDAFGRVLFDHLQGDPALEIVERDDGFVSPGRGAAYWFASDGLPHLEQQTLSLARGRVLDVGCGAGRIALALQRAGHAVVAVDNSPLAVEVCTARGVADTRVLSITQVSCRQLGTFDSVALLGGNFGLCANPRRARWLLRRFHALTGPQGRILADSADPAITDDPTERAYHERNTARGRPPGQVRLRIRYRDYATSWFDHLLVSPAAMAELADGTGWQVADVIGEPGQRRYLAILEKADSGARTPGF